MKKLKYFYYIIAVLLFVGCESDDSDENSSGGIIADFSFTNDGSTFAFINLSEGATSYKWDFGDLYFYSTEKDPVNTYDIVGGELVVTLTAYNEAGQEAYISKPIIAPVVIRANIDIDGDFEDWDELEVTNEFTGSVKKMKYYTRGANINIYFEGEPGMMGVVDMLFNSDEDNTTGYNERWNIGGDYLFEGPPLADGWGSFYSHPGGGNGFSWDWLGLSGHGFESSGVVDIDGETSAIEMRIPKSFFGTVGDTIEFGMWVNWGAEYFPAGDDPVIIEIQ